MPGGYDLRDSRRGQADEHGLGLLGLADPHGSEAVQNPGEVRTRGAEGSEEGVPEQQVDHVQRRLAGRFLPTKVARLEAVDHIPGRRLVLLRQQDLQEQMAQDAAHDDVHPMARDARRWVLRPFLLSSSPPPSSSFVDRSIVNGAHRSRASAFANLRRLGVARTNFERSSTRAFAFRFLERS